MNTINTETLNWAKKLYTGIHMGIPGIAIATGLDEATIAKLVADNNWDNSRSAAFTANQQQLAHLYKLVDELTTAAHAAGSETSLKDADLIKKYTAAIGDLESKDEMARTVFVAKAFTNWLMRKDLKLTKTLTVFFGEYIRLIAAAGSSKDITPDTVPVPRPRPLVQNF